MKKQRTILEDCTHVLKKQLPPQEAMKMVREGAAVFVGLEQVKYLNFSLFETLRMINDTSKPLIINLKNVANDSLHTREFFHHALSHLGSIDYLIEQGKDEIFSIKRAGESFLSNTFFIDEDINHRTDERIHIQKSIFRKSYTRCRITNPKYVKLPDVVGLIESLQQKGLSVAVISGVFDVLHSGHVSLLDQAKNIADAVIVFTNSDYSASMQAKNHLGDRPIHSLEERVAVLSSFDFVDYVTAFDSLTLYDTLKKLGNIIYVKTEKDINKKTVIEEMKIVKENGGNVRILPFHVDKNGGELSSSAIIQETRKSKYVRFTIPEDENWSPQARQLIRQIYLNIKQDQEITKKIYRLKAQLNKRNMSKKNARVTLEKRVAYQIFALAKEISEKLGGKSYYSYIIPYIIGRLVYMDVRIVSLQYNQKGYPYGMMNTVSLIDGRTIFFDVKNNLFQEPFRFEDAYWKLMPHHTHFMARNEKEAFAIRIYAYPSDLHYHALSLRVLFEEYGEPEDEELENELQQIITTVWESIEGSPMKRVAKIKNMYTKHHSQWPGIIAHGGAAILAPDDPLAENSRRGIEYALEEGVDAVEIDINPCKDNWMVVHDQKLEISTGSKGNVLDKTEAELKDLTLRLGKDTKQAEKMISLADALEVVAKLRNGDPRKLYAKIDVKFTVPGLEHKLIEIIKDSGIPLEKILITSQLVGFYKRLHAECSDLHFEFNTVESNLYLLAYQLMQNNWMLDQYLKYIGSYATRLKAKTVSLAQFAVDNWGMEVSQKLIDEMHGMGFKVQLWIAMSVKDYQTAALLGADFMLMQKPDVIAKALELKQTPVVKPRTHYLVSKTVPLFKKEIG